MYRKLIMLLLKAFSYSCVTMYLHKREQIMIKQKKSRIKNRIKNFLSGSRQSFLFFVNLNYLISFNSIIYRLFYLFKENQLLL